MAEIFALTHHAIPERYARNMQTFSSQDQVVLLSAIVCIVGLGGLGGAVTEILARLGIGTLTLVDGDVFEDSNLNRQLLSTPQWMGASKAKAAGKRVREINPSVQTRIHEVFLDSMNGAQLIEGANVVVDCLDNLKDRFVLEKAAKAAGIPLVSAAIAGTYGQITTIFPEDSGLSLIHGPEDQVPTKGAEASLGTLPYTALVMASLECSEIAKILLKRGNLLRNRLLVVDLMDNVMDVLSLLVQ
ncbi:MAG: HesA/MoeB/ThiF family protein [Deltaproteobacteria bacterium]|nr:HesA/MoeB/ThiF family protein [Deltaproteobacteria bacterium]